MPAATAGKIASLDLIPSHHPPAMNDKTRILALLLAAALAVPLAAQNAPAPATSAATQNDEIVEMDTFVVKALTDERNRSIETKRATVGIGDFMSTDRLGQFVDSNIGSVVERLPGVYTSGAGQSGGDGISVRGLGGGFNSLQVDGDRLPSNQGGTRGVSIDNIPAELIGAIEILKAPTPEKEADSIGGLVNVGTKSGLDLKRRLISARASYGFDDYGSGDQYRASISYSDRFAKKIGIFFSLSYSESERLRDEIRSDPADYFFSQLATNDATLPKISAANSQNYFTPGRIDYRRTTQKQDTLGANLNLDWQVRPDWRVSLRTFYTQFDEKRPQIRNLWRFDRSAAGNVNGAATMSRYYVYHDDTDGTFYYGPNQRIQRRVMDQDETEKNLRLQLESVHRWTDSVLDYSVSYGQSKRDLAADMYNFLADRIQMRVNFSDAYDPQLGLIPKDSPYYSTSVKPLVPDFNDPAIYSAGGTNGNFNVENRRAETIDAKDQLYAYAVNYKKMLTENTTVKIGAKYRKQDKVNDRNYVIGPAPFAYSGTATQFAAQNGFFDGRADLGLYPTYDSLYAQNPQRPAEYIAGILGGATPPSDSVRDSTILDIGAREEVAALYAQASWRKDRFAILGGVRWENTSARYSGYSADVTGVASIDGIRPVATKHDYNDFYPSVHLSYQLTSQLLARLSMGRTLARPEFKDISPSSYATKRADSDASNTYITVQEGNAGLKPTQSTNIDLSLEYYFKDGGMASVAGFYKHMKNWVYQTTYIADPALFPQYASVANLRSVEVNSTLNGDTADVYGVELNLQKAIGWGFSVGANATWLTFDVNEAQTGLDRVPGQTSRLLRLSLDYESKRLLARLAIVDDGVVLDTKYSYSDPAAIAFFRSLGAGIMTKAGNGGDVINVGLYDKGGTRLQSTVEYMVTKNIRLFAQMNNMLRKNSQSLLENNDRFVEKNEYRSWTMILGVKVNL